MEIPDLALTIIVATLTMAMLVTLVGLLLAINQSRRSKHRAELAEVRVRHAEEVRTVEREVLRQTLTEVGRDLHDGIGQLLTVGRMNVNELLRTTDAPQRVNELKELLDTTIAEVRRLSRTLNADHWDTLSLSQAMEQECDRAQRAGHVDVRFLRHGPEPVITPDEKLVLFRIFQEALNNALKHASATRIDVLLNDGHGAHLTVGDNGRGFDPTAAGNGQGIANLAHRASLIGYRCEVVSSPTEGTAVRVMPR
ncbi:MAG: hypothetical protein JST66_11555 [Bacteroidetes bacterium]|nr:hypothetical protein [Bacteroidota bacterium]